MRHSKACTCGNTNSFSEFDLRCTNCYTEFKVTRRNPKTVYFVADINGKKVDAIESFYRATQKKLKAIESHKTSVDGFEDYKVIIECNAGKEFTIYENFEGKLELLEL